jgi:hypothetical protein
MKLKILAILVLVAALYFAMNGMCPFPGDEGVYTSEVKAEFREGILVNLSPSNDFDILKSLDIAVNRQKFVPDEWKKEDGKLLVKGKAGNLNATVLYSVENDKINVRVSADGKVFEVRFLVEMCDFEPLIMRGIPCCGFGARPNKY